MKKVKGSKYLEIKSKKDENIGELMIHIDGKKLEKVHRGSCIHHKLPFTNPPVGVPVKKFHNSYIIDGVACSWSCAKAYIIENLFNVKYQNSLTLLTNLYLDFGGNGNIDPSPDWRLLTEFGGPLTKSDFEKGILVRPVISGYTSDPLGSGGMTMYTNPKVYTSTK